MKITKIEIPKTMTGAILGPGGQRVHRFEAECGALISMGDVNEMDKRVFSIMGSDQQVKQAEILVKQAVSPSGGAGGGRGGY